VLLQRESNKKRKKKLRFIREDSDGFRYEKTELYDDQNPHPQTVSQFLDIFYNTGVICSKG
jgi:hypothetical protein